MCITWEVVRHHSRSPICLWELSFSRGIPTDSAFIVGIFRQIRRVVVYLFTDKRPVKLLNVPKLHPMLARTTNHTARATPCMHEQPHVSALAQSHARAITSRLRLLFHISLVFERWSIYCTYRKLQMCMSLYTNELVSILKNPLRARDERRCLTFLLKNYTSHNLNFLKLHIWPIKKPLWHLYRSKGVNTRSCPRKWCEIASLCPLKTDILAYTDQPKNFIFFTYTVSLSGQCVVINRKLRSEIIFQKWSVSCSFLFRTSVLDTGLCNISQTCFIVYTYYATGVWRMAL